jgi:CBS domain-containing protein
MGDDRNGFPDSLDDQDEAYFDSPPALARPFDTRLLRESATQLPPRKPIVLGPAHTVTDAMRAMKGEHRGCVLITEDGTPAAAVIGIFTERDVLFRIVDGGRNPAVLALGDVMTPEPECLEDGQTVAEVLNQMSVGGFRHVPIVDHQRRPTSVVSVRDVVQYLVDAFPREILNLSPDRQSQREGG